MCDKAIKAQYFRDITNLERYLTTNHFLTSVNNEIDKSRNHSYADNLASLETLVLVIFTEDKTVVPKESAWFGSEAEDKPDWDEQKVLGSSSTKDKAIVPMRLQQLYKEDWIGLRRLDNRGGVVFEECKGEHMQIGGCWEKIVRKYVG